MTKPHVLDGTCWCDPEVIHVPPADERPTAFAASLGAAIHDLTTSIEHKRRVREGERDECTVLGIAVADRLGPERIYEHMRYGSAPEPLLRDLEAIQRHSDPDGNEVWVSWFEVRDLIKDARGAAADPDDLYPYGDPPKEQPE